ncbi:MAG: L,D-transpeptidase [Lachnospiraceae bacterium]|nr:L,D-transpeptidase [Lachnospiraceae bacterium]
MKKVPFRFTALVIACLVAFLAAVPVLHTEAAGEALQNPGPRGTITYDFGQGQTFVLDPSGSILLCVQNRDGSFYVDPATGRCVVDPAKCLTFLNALQKMYPRVTGGGSAFKTTRGDLIPLGGAQATVYFDVNTELQWLYAALTSDLTARRTPDFHGVQPGGSYSNTNALGGTYIEIDLTMQALYYYVNGSLVLATPIVSGNVSAGMGTPTGIFAVNGNKRNNTYLTGRNYSSFVYNWMPFIGNSVGIHDATWRSSFGGNIYKTNGSHGCVNLPLDAAAKLYPIVNVGTPVIVFY